jgi:hypothetical protein
MMRLIRKMLNCSSLIVNQRRLKIRRRKKRLELRLLNKSLTKHKLLLLLRQRRLPKLLKLQDSRKLLISKLLRNKRHKKKPMLLRGELLERWPTLITCHQKNKLTWERNRDNKWLIQTWLNLKLNGMKESTAKLTLSGHNLKLSTSLMVKETTNSKKNSTKCGVATTAWTKAFTLSRKRVELFKVRCHRLLILKNLPKNKSNFKPLRRNWRVSTLKVSYTIQK